MKELRYPLYAEGYVNRFVTTGVFTQVQQFQKAVLSGRVNEWLKKGFAIHENPCRKEFIAKRNAELPEYLDISQWGPGEPVTVFDQTHPLRLYFPFGNIGVEESGFYYCPTYLRTYSYTWLSVPEEELAEFELFTCGGMTVWVNDELVTDYTPFTRNLVKHTQVKLLLRKGRNKIVICLDDLAERDTDYYFRLRYMGGQKLAICIPVSEETDTEQVYAVEKILDNIYFEREAYIGTAVNLNVANSTAEMLPLYLTIAPGEFIEKMEHQECLIQTRRFQLEPGMDVLEILAEDELPPAYYNFSVEFRVSGISLARKIGVQIVKQEYLSGSGADIRQRRQNVLEVVAENDVNNVYKAAALLTLGRECEAAQSYILEELPGVNQRKDCSDFHLIIILYIYHTFRDVLMEEVKAAIEDTLVRYRYWIDEPGDDVMWFFSENHALLFHTCQYLAGKYLPDRLFVNSGLRGSEVSRKGEELLQQWYDDFFREFITEWNSNAYIPVDVLGIATLYNLTQDHPALHEKTKRALDMISYSLAVNQHKGAIMASFGRTYEKELKGSYNAGTTSLLYLLYDAGYLNRAANGYLSVAMSDYEPPEAYRKYLDLAGSQELIFQNTQGFEQHVSLYLYKNADVLLSTAIGFKPYQAGYQEHIVEACIDGTAQVFINHPGEVHPYGSGRPNFWAGNGCLPMAVQYRNLAIVKYDIGEEFRIDYTHAYIPLSEFKKYQGEERCIVLEKDSGYIGVLVENGCTMQKTGPASYREFVSPGRKNVWVVRVAGHGEFASLDEFFEHMKSIELQRNGEEVRVLEKKTTYLLTQDDVLLVDGKPVHHYPLDVAGKIEYRED